jgi:hypothetical protein
MGSFEDFEEWRKDGSEKISCLTVSSTRELNNPLKVLATKSLMVESTMQLLQPKRESGWSGRPMILIFGFILGP